jgi:hypothetical protein
VMMSRLITLRKVYCLNLFTSTDLTS